MIIWILANDRDERCTTVSEHIWSKPQTKDNLRVELDRYKRNGVKAKFGN